MKGTIICPKPKMMGENLPHLKAISKKRTNQKSISRKWFQSKVMYSIAEKLHAGRRTRRCSQNVLEKVKREEGEEKIANVVEIDRVIF